MRVLLTGSTGFVGSYILKNLIERDIVVRTLIRDRKRKLRKMTLPFLETLYRMGKHKLSWDYIEMYHGDILDKDSIVKALDGCDAIIHLVGIIKEKGSATFENIHVIGTKNMVDAAREVGIRRFIHMSALGTSGEAKSLYHQTKYKAEQYLIGSGLEYTIFRPSIIFGPGDGFINLLSKIIKYSPIFFPVVGNGSYRLQPVSAYNVAQIFVDASLDPKTIGKIYEVGGPKVYSFREILDLILEVKGIDMFKIYFPLRLMELIAGLMEAVLPIPLLTRDQLISLTSDNICSEESNKLLQKDFVLNLISLEEGIKEYIS